MYDNQSNAAIGYPQEKSLACVDTRYERTVSENIDAKITALKAEIERLEKSKETLAPLMGMKIRDIREAMNY